MSNLDNFNGFMAAWTENETAQRNKLNAEIDRLKAENERLCKACAIGALLSNMAYNLAQDKSIHETTRNDLNRLRESWDEANRQLGEPIYR